MAQDTVPIGAVLAGGRGRRIGGDKPRVALAGRPLLAYPVAALGAVLEQVAVVGKHETALPELPGVAVWREPAEPRHPLTGVVCALERAAGRPVVVAAGDLPFLTASLVRRVATADGRGRPAVVPCAGGRLQPLLARYEPSALAPLAAALAAPPESLTAVVERLGPTLLDAEADVDAFFNVNVPEDVLTAAALLDRRGAVS